MTMQPIEEILPQTPKELKTILDKLGSLLHESVSFGTHILKWDVEKLREGKDNNMPSVFLRNIVELADAISILISNCSVDPAKIIFRSLLESCYGLLYMLEDNEKQRAYCFMVFKSVEKIKHCNKWISTEQSHAQFKIKLSKDTLDVDLSSYFDHPDFIRVKKQREKLLEKPEFKLVYEEYLRTKKRLDREFHWYTLYNGPKNFIELTEYLGKTVSYEFHYKTFSDNVHGTSVEKGFSDAGGGKAQIIQIRDYENVQELFSHTITVLLELYIVYIRKRIPEKDPEFVAWFNNFKIPYLDITKKKLFEYKK
jgi:Family of unknown function (DUF5677)